MFEKLMTEIFSYLILHKNIYHKPGRVKQAFKPSLLEAEVAPLGVQGHLGLLSKLQATQGYNSETLSLKNNLSARQLVCRTHGVLF